MDRISLVDELASKGKLLSLPQVLSELLEEAKKEDFSSKKLCEIILKDPSLASKILRLANSAFYARPQEVSSISQAISILGATTVKCFALATSIFHPERIASSIGVNARELFSYIMTLASTAEKIARVAAPEHTEEAFIAGLLADSGIIYLVQHYPDEYREVVNRVHKGASISAVEREVIGMDHSELGFRLTQSWHLPSSISKAVENHHEVYSINEVKDLTNIVKLAVLLNSDSLHQQECDHERRLKSIERLTELFGIDQEIVRSLAKDSLFGAIELAKNLDIDIDDVENLLGRANQEIWKSFEVIQRLYKEREILSMKLVKQEGHRVADASRKVAFATFSHYLNNALAIISGRVQIMSMLSNQGKLEILAKETDTTEQHVCNAIQRVLAVMREIREISTFEEIDHFEESDALNIDDRVKRRLELMSNEPDYLLPAGSQLETHSD